ncbi:N-acetylneuraminate epimerase [Pasteurella oralis]|uniref:N-acetylneuraminate epimerase n=1 Tax=Pasteurella oralis TaxID=1071947 RepID=A0ABW4NVN3_9PAST|nr:N-acetylneuraminate epimerase [Pasteurella oralis]MDO5054674.1 N-acetylneuraminate epimerase [Pasteurella oralis]
MKFTKTALFAALAATAFAAQAGQYPDLPEGIKAGAGALVGDTVYVGLGGTGTTKFYSLNLKDPKEWKEIAEFPGGKRNQPVAAGVNGKLYVFGGFQDTDVAKNQIINDAYEYNPADNTWMKLPTRSPRSTSVGASVAADGSKIYFVGGVNHEIWNGLFQDVKAAGGDKEKEKAIFDPYFNLRAQDFFFSPEIISYEPANNVWRNEGYFPYSGRAGAAVAIKEGKLLVVNGEVKAGLRSPGSAIGTIGKDGVTWKKLGDLPAPKGYDKQDGIAGGMGGYTHGHYIVTGGANFPGALANYEKGIMDAHRTGGLKKTYHKDVYALDAKSGNWKIVGELPANIGYGLAVSYNNKVLLIGGETDGGKPLTSVQTMSFDGKKLTVE